MRVVDIEFHTAEEVADLLLALSAPVDEALDLVVLDGPSNCDLVVVFIPSGGMSFVDVGELEGHRGLGYMGVAAFIDKLLHFLDSD